MSQTSLEKSVPEPIVRKLHQVRKRKMYVHIACAVVAALAVLIAAMCVAMLIDWLATLYDSRWRVVLTTTALLAAVLTTFGWFAVAWRRALGIERVAGDVDRQLPQLEERWTTMTRLGADAANPEVIHPAMLRRVAKEAASWEPVVEPTEVVSLSTLMRTMLALTAITAVLAVAVVLDSQRTLVLVRRFWAPGSSISATQLVDVPGDVVVGRGEPLALAAKIEGVPVENATLFLSTQDDASDEINLIAHGDEQIEFSHRMRAVEEPFQYRFRAGDGQTEWYKVDVADRPEIAQLQVVVTPPDYTRRDAEKFDHLPRRISAMQKSTFELALRPTMPVDRAELELGENKRVPLVADKNGWYRWATTLEEAVQLAPKLTESHGLTNRRVPVCDISVYEDRPPAVKVLSPNDEMAVRPDDTIQITFAATDDVGIGSAELLVYESQPGGEPVAVATIPIPLEQAGALSIQKSVDLDLSKFAAQDGAELSYEIRVREQRGQSLQQQPGAPTSSIAASDTAKSNPRGTNTASNTSSSAGTSTGDGKAADASTPSTSAQASTAASSSTAGDAKSDSQAATDSPAAAPASERTAAVTNDETGKSMPAEEAGALPKAPWSAIASRDAKAGADATKSQGTENDVPANVKMQDKSSPAAGGDAKPSEVAANNAAAPKSEALKNETGAPSTGKSASPTSEQAASSKADGSSASTPSANRTASNPSSANAATKAASAAAPKLGENMPNTAANEGSKKGEPMAASRTANDSKAAKGQPAGATNSAAKDMAKNESGKAARQKKPGSPTDETPRTASTGRKGINSDGKTGEQPESLTADSEKGMPENETSRSEEQMADGKQPASSARGESQPSASQQANSDQKSGSQKSSGQQQSSSASQTASSEPQKSSSSDQPPGDSMTRRSLDVSPPQSSNSQRMKLKVDKWAGSFSGQQRAKLEMAIAPELEALDQALAKAQRTARGVLDQLAVDAEWRSSHDREVTNAEKLTVEAQGVIDKLEKRSKGTPYAFVGLQVVEIGLAHVEPARNDFWKTLEADGGDRAAPVRDAVQHLTRARELLKDLRGRFEVTKREFQLAESVEKVKQMYQVYVENSLALLQTQESDPQRYGRKMAQFDLDDEYLKRLKEVLEMRAELQKELARILADDPRLLRRFMDSLRNKSNNLREELAGLVARQDELNREVRAWSTTVEAERPQLERTFMLRHMQRAEAIATAAGKLQERYETWLPLNRESQDADLAVATKRIQDVATAAVELNAEAMRQITASPAAVVPAAAAPDITTTPTAEGGGIVNEAKPQAVGNAAATGIAPLLNKGQRLYEELAQLDVALRQIAAREDDAESASFAANRLIDTRRLIADSSAWQRQMNAFESGKYTGAAEVEQYRLAMKTEELAAKLGGIEQQLAAMLQREDGSLPAPIANKAREFLATLDREASPNQLAAVYALHGNVFPRATYRQQAAGEALTKAEKQYDELMKLAIAELDKLPVQDPIASLLDDPTLDELLAQLEQELRLEELLGIPPRSSNLRIIDDWLRPGNGGGGGGGGSQASGQQMASNQVRADQQRAQRQLDQAYKRTIKRALKETEAMPKVKVAKPARLSDWNQLVSKLGDDLRQGRDKAPPEQYRRAIEQYFSQISREVAAREEKQP